ncbi:hypothetical protein [Sorangium sp. So ce1000]|uniref:hypothetical protein n=1 Tax=Sorangium sp. So ce1000 TaxID=3133325 RepID=UPI003F62D2BD
MSMPGSSSPPAVDEDECEEDEDEDEAGDDDAVAPMSRPMMAMSGVHPASAAPVERSAAKSRGAPVREDAVG